MSDPPPNPQQSPLRYATPMPPPSPFSWNDFISFRTMITVPLIKVLFWVGVVVVIIAALVMMVRGVASQGGGVAVFSGLIVLLVGPVIVRVYCEILIVVFRINETLTEIKHELESRR